MAHFPQPHSSMRAPRAYVPNSESITFSLGGKCVTGVLHKISVTGGLARLTASVGTGTLAEVRLNTKAGPITGLVELLRANKYTGGALQPFRFVAIGEEDHERLSKTVRTMIDRGFAA